ncbi:Fatty acid oxidation complex subunit alpha [Anatilimnocola aggregata]|uniref:enoyl-CoA hydratase n=1 Tax=Anatilimnocola aggregata TaxID=2528021 RepID=A0A517Y7C7_9BACT|nr:3-hydroxyacyl-CoA dehydrogenase NAD-binding domain-containing protein [Anatilimnocola aggregata]QDU26140.1 Fatty acid oxidation complex subunit alpha [Anatilimnocola aggregata]
MTAGSRSITLSFPRAGVALLSFDLPGKSANVLSTEVVVELESHLHALRTMCDLHGVILTSGKPGTFIAGADIREFVGLMDQPGEQVAELCRRGHLLLGQLSDLSAVTVAAIDGVCLGGGLELALACDRRLVTTGPKTQLGLPEVKLGLIPGWGGCVRLPRLIGPAAAVEMITTGQPVSAATAVQSGLASEAVASECLLAAAIDLVEREATSKAYLADRARLRQGVLMNQTELDFLQFTTSAKLAAEAEHQPAAMTALNLIVATAHDDLTTALTAETLAFGHLFGSPASRALVHVFFLQDYNKHTQASATAVARPAQSVSVLGAGIMGIGIAAAALRAGLQVRLGDADESRLPGASAESVQEAAFDPAIKKVDPERAIALAARISTVTTDAELAASDVLIEAIIENYEIKVSVLQKLESLVPPHAILASNTSSIPISRLGSALARPDRFCGMHFFNPVKRMKLVEVIRGTQTSDETINTAIALARKLGKMPVVVTDGPGFLVNRMLSPYLNESIELLHDGHSPREIDAAAVAYGMPLGPLALYDLVGLDTAFYAGRTMYEAFPDRVRASPILPALIKRKRLGRKNNAGFFAYREGVAEPQDDPAAAEILAGYVRSENRLPLAQIQDRLLLVMLFEACRILEEGRVRDARDIDLGVIFGLGFPAFRGGILHWAQSLGGDQIMRKIEPWRERGARYEPPQLLLDWAAGKRTLTA